MSKQDSNIILGVDGKPMYELITKPHHEQEFIHKPVFGKINLLRVGFLSPVPPRHLNNEAYIHDSRPIAWPLYHPYWIVRMSDDANMLMAYVEEIEHVKLYWPEATEVTVFEENVTHYCFNSNFPEPIWLKDVQDPSFRVAPPKTGAFKITELESGLSIIGFSDDTDYDIQLNYHQLEYGVHEHEAFQREYTNWTGLEVNVYATETLEEAEAYARKLLKFENAEDGSLSTTLPL